MDKFYDSISEKRRFIKDIIINSCSFKRARARLQMGNIILPDLCTYPQSNLCTVLQQISV